MGVVVQSWVISPPLVLFLSVYIYIYIYMCVCVCVCVSACVNAPFVFEHERIQEGHALVE